MTKQQNLDGKKQDMSGMAGESEVAELFGKWAAQNGLLARITEDQCADLAQAFIAGYFYGQNPILRERLGSGEDHLASSSEKGT